MPLYTALIEEGSVSEAAKVLIASEITDIHSAIMNVPRELVRVIFLCFPRGSGYSAGKKATTAALNCTLRFGHTEQEKTDLLAQVWEVFQRNTGIATNQLAISLQELPPSNAMEMGQIMLPVGEALADLEL